MSLNTYDSFSFSFHFDPQLKLVSLSYRFEFHTTTTKTQWHYLCKWRKDFTSTFASRTGFV